MKVLHVATYDCVGGAARAAYRQHLALRGAGVNSRMLVRFKHANDPHVHVFSGTGGLRWRAERTLRRAWIKFCEKQSRAANNTGLTDPRADLLRSAVPEMADADVINVHQTDRFADIPALLAALPATKPVVITLHDLSPITGGCNYPGNCEGFTNRCGACPMLGSHRENDYSREIFQMRQAAYGTRAAKHFALAANSRWTLECIARSGLAKNYRSELIHYGIDQNIYHARNRAAARQALGIGENEAVICFAAQHLNDARKGGAELKQALAELTWQGPICLVTMGSNYMGTPASFRHIHFGKIDSDALQSVVYRAADVFVMPSLEEAFGQTALEAVACGAVVAGFSVGGIVDIVQNGLNGRLVECRNAEALRKAIVQLLDDGGMRKQWLERCELWVGERFSYDRNATAYCALYESLLQGG